MVIRELSRRWGECRQLTRELKSYSDAELAELGLTRSACVRVAFEAAFGGALKSLRDGLRRREYIALWRHER